MEVMFIKACWNCKNRECYTLGAIPDFRNNCKENGYSQWKYDEKKPLYTMDVAKQLIFDCAMECIYHAKEQTSEEIGNDLLNIVHEMDKMRS